MSHTNPLPMLPDVQAFQNTDREVWRETPGDFYSNSVHLTATGGLGINVGGTVHVKPPAEWHRLASGARSTAAQPAALPEPVLQALRFYANGDHYITDDAEDFDTVSGEPENWLCSGLEDSSTMIETGRIARFALTGEALNWIDGGEDQQPKPVAGEAFGPAAAQPVEPTGLKLVPIELTGAMWSAGRHEFTAQAQRWKHAPTSDAASVVADVAPGEIHRAMLAAAPPAASGDSTPPSAPVRGDPSGALRPEPEAAGQDLSGITVYSPCERHKGLPIEFTATVSVARRICPRCEQEKTGDQR